MRSCRCPTEEQLRRGSKRRRIPEEEGEEEEEEGRCGPVPACVARGSWHEEEEGEGGRTSPGVDT